MEISTCIKDKKVIDKLYKFVKNSGKKFPGQFIDTLTLVKGPFVNYVNDLIIQLMNSEAELYDSKIENYSKED